MSRIIETMNRAELLRIARELEAENEALKKRLADQEQPLHGKGPKGSGKAPTGEQGA